MSGELRRFLDGELSEGESQRFLLALENDPNLERELRQMELLLRAGQSLVDPRLPDGFKDEVLERVRSEDRTRSSDLRSARAAPRPRWWHPGFAVAAALVFFFTGLQVGRQPGPQSVAIPTVGEASAAPRLHTVRLVYVPTSQGSLEEVHVAGDFNAWNASATPMRRQGAAWVTTLILPEGEYEYMFVEDEQRWVTDPLAQRTREDGFGGSNGVLEIGI